MFNPRLLDEISAKLSEAVANSPAKDVEKNVRHLMSQGFQKMDLVTREEFEIQVQVLAKTRSKLDSLEDKVSELEKLVAKN